MRLFDEKGPAYPFLSVGSLELLSLRESPNPSAIWTGIVRSFVAYTGEGVGTVADVTKSYTSFGVVVVVLVVVVVVAVVVLTAGFFGPPQRRHTTFFAKL